MEDEYDWINETSFWNVLGPAFMKLYHRKAKLWSETGDSSVISFSDWNKFDKRIEILYKRLTALRDHLRDVKSTTKYMDLKGLNRFLVTNRIERSEYSRFIYENHQIRIVSTLDIMAKLGILVYNLKIPRRYCNWSSFIKHKSVRETESARILDEFSTLIWADKFERNEIIHSGGYKHFLIESIWSTELDDEELGNDSILKEYFSKERLQSLRKLMDRMNFNYDQTLKYSREFVESLTHELRESLKDDPR